MPHIFKTFGLKEVEKAQFKVEKNTKKAVQEAINEMTTMLHGRSVIIDVDATEVKDLDKLVTLLNFAFRSYRNIGSRLICGIKLTLSEEFPVTEITDQHRKLFSEARRYLDVKDDISLDTLITFNQFIVEGIDSILIKYNELKEHYEREIEKAKGKSTDLIFKRRFNFSNYQSNLRELYRKCFNELDHLLDPASGTNPSPSFQRALVWSLDKKQSFIQSVVNEIPIGIFYINQQPDYDPDWKLGEGYGELLWDGKQRIHALHSFILGEFDVEVNGRHLFYYDDSHFFNMKFGDCNISISMSRFDNMRDIIEAYVVINSAQVKHTDEDLQKAIDYLANFEA